MGDPQKVGRDMSISSRGGRSVQTGPGPSRLEPAVWLCAMDMSRNRYIYTSKGQLVMEQSVGVSVSANLFFQNSDEEKVRW